MMECYDKDANFYTSVITIEEYMVFPYRNEEQQYIDVFERMLEELSFHVIEIDKKIAKTAARITVKTI